MKHHGGNRRGPGRREGGGEQTRGRAPRTQDVDARRRQIDAQRGDINDRGREAGAHRSDKSAHRLQNDPHRREFVTPRGENDAHRRPVDAHRPDANAHRPENDAHRHDKNTHRGRKGAHGRGNESPGERVARAFGGGAERVHAPRFAEGEPREPAHRQQSEEDGAHVFGVQPVLEALRAGTRPVERLTVAEGAHESRLREILEIARYADIPVRRVPRPELQRLAAGANHQGVIATIAAAHYTHADELLDALAARVGTEEPPLAVVLDGVEDPRNLGAVIRTVECAGAHGVFVPERRASGLTETVAKAAAGALEYVPVSRAANVVRLIEELKGRGIWTVGTAAGAETSYADWDWTQPCALLLGGEGEGLRRLVRERCDVLVSIPLRGQIESLNVSVAAGIVLYEAVRQRTARRRDAYKDTGTMNDEG
ncbi:MAG TPA: 23S rRNA (guanosine(2251)-2'-O)-methyltransferase RlmB [Pyrinomonadaceae bacterium]|jgi:23S rRNA (guanosine2251-2'-O)-methyltransferase